MGLFEKLGRNVERFKQDAKAAANESAVYECQGCGERLHAEHEECPECGSDDLLKVDETSEDATEST